MQYRTMPWQSACIHCVHTIHVLAVEQRESKDERSWGELFYLLMDELPDICLAEAVRLLVPVFAERLLEWTMLAEQGGTGAVGRLLRRTAVAVVTKTAKICITNVFFLVTKPYFSSFNECF